ncbi:beta-glucosidase family protein [Corynebacterium uterequi]|uniref:Beta-glucosidase-like glycosyl hydrolase n=1 Tax=Corynebacterium uterequi TaxID=1072256 RepID=A0A0G3HAQ7_9CORY|nr:glycoside hydrolase family 3 C-terminal domain-containing protein [Corynebacterium uterequi]AKK10424.1 beta-glucosidase-like glycosyl hydrolase [Corynebacterium uterequi]
MTADTTPPQPWMDTTKSPRERAELLVAEMTLEQKVDQLGGAMTTINPYNIDMADFDVDQFNVWRHADPIDELSIPRLNITNGPVGVGMGDGVPSPPATALPATLGLAATFDKNLARRYGAFMGKETRALGQHLLEAPGMCLARITTGGRNFEYFSEDPYLSGVMGAEVTQGIQSNGIIAEAKHYALNDEEEQRFRYDVRADEHVMRELYLLPFEMTVKDGDVACIMGSYQRINGTYGCENYWLLTQVLREQWGFEGYVQSDFWAVRSTAQSLNAGLDHEMPDHNWMNMESIQHALDQRILEMATIDRALVRRYTQMFRFGQFDEVFDKTGIDIPAGSAFAREAAAEVIVLLKNEQQLLPLTPQDSGSILIVGIDDFANQICNCGGGSSQVIPTKPVVPAEGLRDVLAELGADNTVEVFTVADDMSNLAEAAEAAASAGTVLIMAGLVTTEGADQKDMNLPKHQNELIDALAGVNPRTVVVLKDGDPVLMPWLDKAHTLLECFNQGQEDGHAVADVLFGNHNPAAKLPMTYPVSEDDTCYAGNPSRYPGVDEGAGYPVMRYSEGLEMGYRWYQAQDITPMFEFGYGLSYTTFALNNLDVAAEGVRSGVEETWSTAGREPGTVAGTVTVSVDVTNTGDRAGAEVVQVYAEIPVAGQPPRRLVGFDKVHVKPGETATAVVKLELNSASHPFGVWDANAQSFAVRPGTYTLHVGTSSANTPFSATVEVK